MLLPKPLAWEDDSLSPVNNRKVIDIVVNFEAFNDGMNQSYSQSTFGQYIKSRRLEMKLTQSEVAKKLNVAQNFITYLEKNRRKPTNSMIKKIADILSLPVDQLYFSAHPEINEMVNLNQKTPVSSQQIPLSLLELKEDKELRQKHRITDLEIDELASMRLRSLIKSKEDYVFLLMSIRQVMK